MSNHDVCTHTPTHLLNDDRLARAITIKQTEIHIQHLALAIMVSEATCYNINCQHHNSMFGHTLMLQYKQVTIVHTTQNT